MDRGADRRVTAYNVAAARILDEVEAERYRQDEKWGQQNHPNGTGETRQRVDADECRAVCQRNFARGDGTWHDVLLEEVAEAFAERETAKLREELVQVAAVAVAWIECLDRNG